MKRYFALMLIAILGMAVNAMAENNRPGLITSTSVANSGTASSWYLVTGSKSPWYDFLGNPVVPQAYQIEVISGSSPTNLEATPVDFCFAYTNSPTASAWFYWRAAWGPYQTSENLPPEGIYISATPTSGTYTAKMQTKH